MNLIGPVILKEDSRVRGYRHNERVIRVLIADDQELVRTGFRVILEAEGDIEVIAEAENGHEAVRQAALAKPEVVLMDIRMPELDGLAATEQILRQQDPPTIVVLTTFDQNEYIYRALRAGAAGFLLKDAEPAELIRAVRVVAGGEALLSPSVTRRVLARFGGASGPPVDLGVLTEREREVAAWVATGRSNDEIAAALAVSPATIRTHVGRAMLKLNARDRAQLAVYAIRAGLIPKAT